VAVGGTVNSDPRAWVNNCAPGQPCDGDAALSLSRQVLKELVCCFLPRAS